MISKMIILIMFLKMLCAYFNVRPFAFVSFALTFPHQFKNLKI